MSPRERTSGITIEVAVAALAAIAAVLFLLGKLGGEPPATRRSSAAPEPAAADRRPPVARRAAAIPGEELVPPARQELATLDQHVAVAGQPVNPPSFSGKPMEPVLPSLNEVRARLTPHIARCVEDAAGREARPADPLQVRLRLFIEGAEARVEFEKVEPQAEREFPALDACLAAALPELRFAVSSPPPADYARDGVFHLPWVARVSLAGQGGGG